MAAFFQETTNTNVGRESVEDDNSCSSRLTIKASNLAPKPLFRRMSSERDGNEMTLAQALVPYIQTSMTAPRMRARDFSSRLASSISPEIQTFDRDYFLNYTSDGLEVPQDREDFENVRRQIEELELDEGMRVLKEALAQASRGESPDGPSLPRAVPPVASVRGASSSQASSSLDSSPRRPRTVGECSSVSFAGSVYSIDVDIAQALTNVIGRLPDRLVAEQIRLLQMARTDETDDDWEGNSDRAAKFYHDFRQFLDSTATRQELGRKQFLIGMALGGLDEMTSDALRFVHVREVLLEMSRETVETLPPYSHGTVEGSTFADE